MEIELESLESPDMQQKIAVAESLWTVINTPAIKIFSLKKSESERRLGVFLDLLNRDSENFIKILIPPFQSIPKYDHLRIQYSAFTTWLFGVLFYVVGDTLNTQVLISSLEVQTCMLRILARLHLSEFQRITQEYLSILDLILDFEELKNEGDKLTITKFVVAPDAIEKLELIHFPVTIDRSAIASMEICILRIIIKSGAHSWNRDGLWTRLMRIIVNCEMEVKLACMEIVSQLSKSADQHNEENIQVFVKYSIEVIRKISICQVPRSEGIKSNMLSQAADILNSLLKSLSNSEDAVHLSFAIIEALASGRLSSDFLEFSVVEKIRDYLLLHPRTHSAAEGMNLLQNINKLANFHAILPHFIVYELSTSTMQGSLVAVQSSSLWRSIHTSILGAVESKKILELKKLLEIARTVSLWMTSKKIRGRLFDDATSLFTSLRSIFEAAQDVNDLHLIFNCLIELMTLEELPKDQLQKILYLPWFLDKSSHNLDNIRRIFNAMKSLDIKTKLRCLEFICEFGQGASRIKYLSTCVTNNEIELAVSAVLNSVLLLSDPRISFAEINIHILKPAVVGERIPLQEAVSKVIGGMVCYLSSKCMIIRPEWDALTWKIDCSICDRDCKQQKLGDDKFPVDEAIFSYYFSLITSKHSEVRRNMSENLIRFSNHLTIFSSEGVSKTWIRLINDSNVVTRKNFANSIGILARIKLKLILRNAGVGSSEKITNEVPQQLETFIDSIIEELGDGLTQALETCNECLQITIINTAKEFAKVELFSHERQLCRIFIISIMHSESFTAMAAASEAFKEVADFGNLTPYELFLRYRKDFIELITQILSQNYVDKNYSIVKSLSKIVRCFGYSGTREFIRKDGSLLVRQLVPMSMKFPKIRDIFKMISDSLSIDERDMFVEYFHEICSYIFLNETPDMTADCLELVSEITKIEVPSLMNISFTGIFQKLLLHFHDKLERVLIYLELISEYDPDHKGSFEDNQSIANYLKPHLHAVLVKFDTNLGPLSDEFTQRTALGSLGALLKFMGPDHISPLRYKILTTLRTCLLNLKRPGFLKLSCYTWDCFLRSVSFDELGPLLPTICVSISVLLESYPEEGSKLLEYLLIENNASLAGYIEEIFFINDLRVAPRIASVVSAQVKRSMPKNFEDGLKVWLRRIKHETDDVRLRALVHLRKFLELHRSQLNALILNNTNIHPLVMDLLDALLIGCQEKDENIRLKCGECLGELGAIEPSLLPCRIISTDDIKFIPQMNEDFAFEVLQELVRALQMEKITQNVACFSLAIQEILKVFDISPTGKKSRVWNSLSSTIQERILPLLNSRYKHTADPDIVDSPVYGSAAGSTFEKWIYHWTCSMVASVKDPNLFSVLSACQPALRRDTRTTMLVIPHIFIYIVTKGLNDDRDRLIGEILAVIKSGDQTLDPELTTRWPLRDKFNGKRSDEIRVSDEARRIRCSQVVFAILDYVMRWLVEKRKEKDELYPLVDDFLNRLDSLVLAKACYQSHEYHRALMYLERHMSTKNKGLEDQEESSLLAKIYIQLEEPDGVSGILATQEQSPTLQQLVVAHEVSGQLQDAAICYEKLAQKLNQLKHIQGMIHCYLGLDQAYTAMKFTEGVLSSRPELEPLVVEHEPFWRLANFVQLAGDTNNTIKKDILEDLKRGIKPDLEGVKKNLVSLLGAVSHKVSYLQQSYPYILKLHILNEFEKATTLLLKSSSNLPKILNEWEQRDQLIRASRGVESVLGMRRATLDLFSELLESDERNEARATALLTLKEEIGKIWLKSAKIARKSGLYQQAYKYILSASDSCPQQELSIEQAQLYWQRDFQEEALMTLKRSFTNCFHPTSHYESLPHDVCTPDRKNFAKAKLLFAKYNEETLKVSAMVNKEYYKEAYNSWRCWEKTPLAFAQYTESLIENYTEAQRDMCDKELYNVINYCGRSLQFGCKYVHHSMPKMLTTWMDFAENVHRNRSPPKERVEMVKKMTHIIDAYCTRLPTYIWLTAMSQLISRISHPSRVVQEQLIKILVKLIVAHPQYCLWMMACVLNSEKSPQTGVVSTESRQLTFKERIWHHKDLRNPEIRKTMDSFKGLWQKLISFTAVKVDSGVSKLKVSAVCRELPILLRSSEFGPIMMPTTQFFNLSLPRTPSSEVNNLLSSNSNISIVGIEEEVIVMTSAQKPKKITLRGSDGKRYIFMCKPADDLRRDFRLMEFNGIVNQYLQKDADSRQRRLYIRTYSVVPLTEDCGIIEWVQNLLPFRQALLSLYKEKGLGMGNREASKLMVPVREKLSVKRKVFLEKLLPKYPPVLGDWFRIRFPDARAWYEARNAYIRTTAVMSMVGYILGLGDRHGENILFDCTCGDAVHVDFNCLFNAGETLTYPERVPFRLTHNMVSAMGPLKYEGPFRKSCETTLRLLRQQSKTLLSVLKPFLYTENAAHAEQHLKRIEKRLAGYVVIVDKKDESSDFRSISSTSMKFGVEGQVNHLIQDATDIDNLCRMYFGWGAHL